jgi:hypothetical protein
MKKENLTKEEMLLKYGDIESEPRYERLDSSMLHADLSYQNVFDPAIVNKIFTNFKKSLLRPLEVSFRDGQYNVIDGKHRLSGIKELEKETGIKIPVPCWVHYGLTAEGECKLFVDLENEKRTIGSMELYKAAYEANDDYTVNFVNTIRKIGFIFDFCSSSKNGRIHMASTPASILDKLGQEDFERFLILIYDTWNGNKDFLTQKFLKGMCNFYENYKEDIDDKLFVKRLSILTKDELDLSLVRNIGNDKSIVIANCIFNKYNRNKKMYPNNILNPKSYFYMFKN